MFIKMIISTFHVIRKTTRHEASLTVSDYNLDAGLVMVHMMLLW